MYSYSFDIETGGLILNSTPTVFSKEPRPVYSYEMDLLGFNEYWDYEQQNAIPYMWCESNVYWYKGTAIAKIKGGDLYHSPILTPCMDDNEQVLFGKHSGYRLQPINIDGMNAKNKDLLAVMEETTVKMIVKEYQKFKDKLDIFHVAFSGGKDSAVLLDLVKKALPKGSFVVIFGDTGMEFPDTYKAVEITKSQCEQDGTPFYIAQSHFKPEDSWKIFGPPARVLRWCCSVHKSTPQTLKMREITGKNNYVGLDFVGVRKEESLARSKYDYENFGKKQKGQYSFNPILDWTSAEIWLYILGNNLYVNEAYKKGNSRAGCLFCPMGGGKNDFIQYSSYKEQVSVYIDLIKSMNARNANNDEALCSYVCNGGWNARKNGRDLTIEEDRYLEEIKNEQLEITIISPNTRWQEWIKTLGQIPFYYEIKECPNGYKVTIRLSDIKEYPREAKKIKQVFKKSAYCQGCRVCETNCRNGCISFNGGLAINNCVHCGQCHEIDDGCLLYHSIKRSRGDGTMRKGSINSFANHAPKPEWVQEFFDLGDEFWADGNNGLGPNQLPMFKKFLRESGLIDAKNHTTELFNIVSNRGWRDNASWGLIITNFSYNPQCRWYIENMEVGLYYERNKISDMLILDGVKKDDATSIINAFKRFVELPMGQVANWGYIEEKGRQIETLSRQKCYIEDNRVVLYALYKFAEACNIEGREMHLSYILDDDIEKDGISPAKMFGIYDEEEWKSILLGLTAAYPDFINATFTNDLKTITLKDKTSNDVLNLFREEM